MRKTFNQPISPKWPDYGCNVYKNGEFIVAHLYENYSGYAMADEVMYLRRFEYPSSEGYTIEW
jgi:hypothetical protein